MKLSKLTRSRPTNLTIDVMGDPVTIVYDRASIVDAFFELPTVRAKVAQTLLSWDVTDDGGAPYQPRDDANSSRPTEWLKLFAPLPDDVIQVIYRALLEDFYAGKPRGGDSSVS